MDNTDFIAKNTSSSNQNEININENMMNNAITNQKEQEIPNFTPTIDAPAFKLTLSFACFCIVEFLYSSGYSQMLVFFPPVIVNDPDNCPDYVVGIIIGSLGIGGLVSSFFYKLFIKHFKRRHIFLSCNLMAAAIIFTFPFFSNPSNKHVLSPFLITFLSSLWEFMLGFVRIGIITLAMALTAVIYPKDVVKKYSILVAFMGMGGVFGPGLGSVLYSFFGYEIPFFVFGILLMLNILIFYWFLPVELDIHKSETAQHSQGSQQHNESKRPNKNLRMPLLDKRVLFNIVAFGQMTIFNRVQSTGSSILLTSPPYSINKDYLGYYILVLALIVVAYALISGFFGKYVDSRIMNFIFGMIVPGIGFCLMGQTTILPFIHPNSKWWPLLGILLGNVPVPTMMAHCASDSLKTLKDDYGIESVKTKDEISSKLIQQKFYPKDYMTALLLISWSIGPPMYSIMTALHVSYSNQCAALGLIQIAFGFVYLFGTNFVTCKSKNNKIDNSQEQYRNNTFDESRTAYQTVDNSNKIFDARQTNQS